MPVSSLLSAIEQQFAAQADRLGLQVGDQRLSYAELDRASRVAAAELAARGLCAGDTVGLWSVPPKAEFFVSLLGLLRLGAVPVPLSSKLSLGHLEHIARTAELAMILSDDPKPLPLDGQRVETFPGLDGDEAPAPAPVDGEALAVLLFTSGSTGSPKGVMLTHDALGGNALGTAQVLGLSPEDRWYFNTPFAFTSAICHFLTGIAAGASVLAQDAFLFPGQTVGAIAELEATGFAGSPTQIRWFVEAVQQREDIPTLKKLMTSGDVMPESTIRMVADRLPGVDYFYVYGMTELAGRFCICPPEMSLPKLGSVGRPIPGLACEIRDPETREPMPAGTVGEVFAKGALVMQGYLNLPDKTAQTLSEFGLSSGDLGRLDEDGFLYLEGRLDDVFKSGGEKVSTVLIEKTLIGLGLFKDVAVTSVPDEYLHLVPKVFYVMEGDRELDRKAVLEALRRELPESHIPQHFEALPEIPRTGSGKVQRAVLRQMEEQR